MCSITTPYLDRHNDHLDIYILRQKDNTFKLTDDGYTIGDLSMSGFDVNTPKRESILKTTLNGFGVKLNGNNELYVEATTQNVGQKKFALIQAMLAVNDMFTLAKETVFSLFKEDVESYLRSKNILFTKDIKLTGKSGFDQHIDFLIPAFHIKPERLVRTVNVPKRDTVLTSIMAFKDIAEMRDATTVNYVVYNDIERTVSADVVSALDNYGVKHIPWSEKERCIEEFSLS